MRKTKLKHEKNNGKKTNETLDCKHEEYLNEFFIDEQEILPNLEKKRNDLKNEYNEDGKSFDQLLEIKNSIKDIDIEIKKLKYYQLI